MQGSVARHIDQRGIGVLVDHEVLDLRNVGLGEIGRQRLCDQGLAGVVACVDVDSRAVGEVVDDGEVTLHHGDADGRRVPGVGDRGVGVGLLDEELDAVEPAVGAGVVHDRVVARVDGVRHGAHVQQVAGGRQVAVHHGVHERRALDLAAAVDDGLVLDQQLDALEVAAHGSDAERRLLVGGRELEVGLGVDQSAHRIGVPVVRGIVQGRALRAVGQVDDGRWRVSLKVVVVVGLLLVVVVVAITVNAGCCGGGGRRRGGGDRLVGLIGRAKQQGNVVGASVHGSDHEWRLALLVRLANVDATREQELERPGADARSSVVHRTTTVGVEDVVLGSDRQQLLEELGVRIDARAVDGRDRLVAVRLLGDRDATEHRERLVVLEAQRLLVQEVEAITAVGHECLDELASDEIVTGTNDLVHIVRELGNLVECHLSHHNTTRERERERESPEY